MRFLSPTLLLAILALLAQRLSHAEAPQAQPMPSFTVTLFALSDDDWWKNYEGRDATPEALWQHLLKDTSAGHPQRLVEAELTLNATGHAEWKRGETMSFGAEWTGNPATDKTAKIEERAKEFVGTVITLEAKGDAYPDGSREVTLSIIRDVAAPQMRPFNYGTAAATPEQRLAESIELPQFARVAANPILMVKPRVNLLAASMRHGGSDATESALRYLVFIEAHGTADSAPTIASNASAPPSLELRQTIIRVPEMAVLDYLLAEPHSEAQLSEQLQHWLQQGQARVIADASAAARLNQTSRVHPQHCFLIPTERDQDLDTPRLWMLPLSISPNYIGQLCTGKLNALATHARDGRVRLAIESHFSPREPITVQWPTSWPTENPKPPHGWLDQLDAFSTQLNMEQHLQLGRPVTAALLAPADQLWPGRGKTRMLDAYQLTARRADGQASEPIQLSPDSEPHEVTRTLLIGIIIPGQAALDLILQRQQPGGKDDAALLAKLLAEVKTGSARLHLSALCRSSADYVCTASTARLHEYPTEMPSYPSAWETTRVGSEIEIDDYASQSDASESGMSLSLTQALSAPRFQDWPLSLDDPALICRQPIFRDLRLSSTFHKAHRGTQLLALQRVPECLGNDGFSSGDTLLLFTHQHVAPDLDDPQRQLPPAAKVSTQPHSVEAELMVFEVPASEEDEWLGPGKGLFTFDDAKRFSSIIQRAQRREVPLVAHAMVQTFIDQDAQLSLTDSMLTATEYDPPEPATPHFMRPTAFEMLPTGDTWKLKLSREAENGDPLKGNALRLTHDFTHSTAQPAEPKLQALIKAAAADPNGAVPFPTAEVFAEDWKEPELITLGKPLCLGTRKPPGCKRDVLHVAFVITRPAAD